ncbi:hypothetical protein JOF29_002608 [Kribbella aluminosa]|uniref:Uncharacterized protein n=1 Tax=Kribbella aluminosa TaxID=416017 RepID=A0ABS4UIU2_9ACTN|nr:hypothetical protein [Kribbella aluminosa]MBP2351525.1 hypothetical protein [Kribbella aluminosa]
MSSLPTPSAHSDDLGRADTSGPPMRAAAPSAPARHALPLAVSGCASVLRAGSAVPARACWIEGSCR